MSIIWSANNPVSGSRGLCLEDYSSFVGFCQEMSKYDTCKHFSAIGPQGLATLCIQISLASKAGSQDGLRRQRTEIKQGLISSAFGGNGSAPCVRN